MRKEATIVQPPAVAQTPMVDLRLGEALRLLRLRRELTMSAAARLHRRTAIPAPPAPYIAHPYTLSQVRELVGEDDQHN